MADTQQKGRIAPPSAEYTFPGSGITIRIRKVSPLLRDDIDAQLRLEFPSPEIPMARRNYGTEDEPDWIDEPNPFDPVYKEEQKKWLVQHANRVGDKLLWVAVRRGIELQLDEEMKAEVDSIREDFKLIGVDLDPDDKFVYVTRICLQTLDELRELHDVIFSQARPSREVIEALKATFPSEVQGEGRLQVPATEGSGVVVRRVQLDGSVETIEGPVA